MKSTTLKHVYRQTVVGGVLVVTGLLWDADGEPRQRNRSYFFCQRKDQFSVEWFSENVDDWNDEQSIGLHSEYSIYLFFLEVWRDEVRGSLNRGEEEEAKVDCPGPMPIQKFSDYHFR